MPISMRTDLWLREMDYDSIYGQWIMDIKFILTCIAVNGSYGVLVFRCSEHNFCYCLTTKYIRRNILCGAFVLFRL